MEKMQDAASTAAASPALSMVSNNMRASILDTGFRRYPQPMTSHQEDTRREHEETSMYNYRPKTAGSTYSQGRAEIQDDHMNFSRAISRRSSRNSLRSELEMHDSQPNRDHQEPSRMAHTRGGLVRPSPSFRPGEYMRKSARSESSDIESAFGKEFESLSATTKKILFRDE